MEPKDDAAAAAKDEAPPSPPSSPKDRAQAILSVRGLLLAAVSFAIIAAGSAVLSLPMPPAPQPTNTPPHPTIQGFLAEQGVAVDDGLDGIAAGLSALLGGGSDEEDEEGDGKMKTPAFVTETYTRRRPPTSSSSQQQEQQQELPPLPGPAELELSLASSHHSLWGTRPPNPPPPFARARPSVQ